jgi:hypothetical protein
VLTLVVLWLTLGGLCAATGLALMGPAASLFPRSGDRFAFAVFLGLGTDGALLLAWSLIAPVGPLALLVCAALAFTAVAAQPAARASLRGCIGAARAGLSGLSIAAGLALILLFAERTTAAGNLNDSGGYHVPLVRWLAEYGTVRGVALVQNRFGFVSSWLAWSAAFDHGPLAGRIGTLMNGFLFLLCLGQLCIVTRRIWRRAFSAPDLLILMAWFIQLPTIAHWDMRTSPSPDLYVFAVIIALAWAMLVIEAHAPQVPDPSPVLQRARFAVMLLGLGAFLVKLSAAPLAAAGGLYYIGAQRSGRPRRLAVALVVGALFAGVLASAGLLSAGCAFFPWPHLCADVPWSVGRDAAVQATIVVRDFTLGPVPHPELHGVDVLPLWLENNYDVVRWLIASAIAGAWLFARRRTFDIPGLGWAAIVPAVGIPYFMITAPSIRFGWSYLMLLPLLALITLRRHIARLTVRWIASAPLRRRLAVLLLLAGVIHVIEPLYKEFSDFKRRAVPFASFDARKQGDPQVNAFNERWWLLPNAYAEQPGFSLARAADFNYAVAPNSTWLCWHHALPCATSDLAAVRLRDSAEGFAAGFRR